MLTPPALPPFVPLLYHKGRRDKRFNRGVAALPLYALLGKRSGQGKFASREALCEAFGLSQDTTIVLTGTEQDPPLERWWGYGEGGRREAIENLRRLGIALVTTPNYSLFANMPRWDDLHSMKRIALVQAEFAQGGVPAALHINGRTERDFTRWGNFLAERPEITHVAYEFGTGAGRSERMPQHLDWLISVAHAAGRPLTLVVRGGLAALSSLASAYANVVFLDTDVFMKTMNRQSAVRAGNASIRWQGAPTIEGAPLDALFDNNNDDREAIVRLLLARALEPVAA